MKLLILLLVLSSGASFSKDWVIVEGGLSPDKTLAVAVYPQKPDPEESDQSVILVDQKSQKKIASLDGISSAGGRWGNPTENVRCEWSAKGDLLLVNFRAGRLMNSYEIYRIKDRRAIPLELPDAKTHPKGKIMDVLEFSSNCGATVHLLEDGTIFKAVYGLYPKADHWEDLSKYGLEDFESVFYFHYRFDPAGELKLLDITTKKPEVSPS